MRASQHIKSVFARSREREKACNTTIIKSNFKTFLGLLNFMKEKIAGRFVLDYCDLIITTRCSLKCYDCSNLMQYYEHPIDYPVQQIADDLDIFMSAIDGLNEIVIIGGEPFMHKEFAQLLNQVLKHDKIKAVKIITNGTIIPNSASLQVLKSPKVWVSVSGYPKAIAKNTDKLLQVLKDNQINHRYNPIPSWTSHGGVYFRNRNEYQLKDIFSRCFTSNCLCLFNGKFHTCPYSAHLCDLGYALVSDYDCVDIRAVPSKHLRDALLSFLKYKKGYVTACNYCNLANTESVQPAIQTLHVLSNSMSRIPKKEQ